MVTTKNYSDSTGAGAMTALGTVSLSPALLKYLKDKRGMWKTFGKMNSHLYRALLFNKMDEMKLTAEAKLLVFAMSAVIKNQPRIVQAMKDTPAEEQFTGSDIWFQVRNFFETECTQYVSKAKSNKKFPVVNMPNTLPGMDILLFCLITEDADRTMTNLSHRPTFVQIHLRNDAQMKAKEGNEYFWTSIVKGTRNDDKVEEASFKENYYNTSAGDTYPLYILDSKGQIIEFPKVNSKEGYSLPEVETYLRNFDEKGPASTTATASAGAR